MKDFGNIVYRPETKAYVIRNNTYTVPHPDDETVPAEIHAEFDALYAEVDAYSKEHPDMVTEEQPYEPTPEEIAAAELAEAKGERAEAVSQIVVTVDGMDFDGDEVSQERMARTITAATATGEDMSATTTWVLHDNTVATVTIQQLATALRLAGEKQTELWTIPYENEE